MSVEQYSCETGQAGYRQLSENTRKSNLLQLMLLFTKAALYPQLFKEPEGWFSWGLNQQPLPQHTCPIELMGQLEVMSLSILPISLVAVGSSFITHLNILNIWLCCHYFHLPFTDQALSMYNNLLYTNKRRMPMAFYTTTYLWKVAPLYPWGTPLFLKKISKINTVCI